MGFLGELSSGLSFTVNFFKTSSFLSLLVGFSPAFSGGKEGHTSYHPNVLEDQISEEKFFCLLY